MKKLFWFSLNPTEKLKRFKSNFILLIIAIILCFIKFELLLAIFISLMLLLIAYLEYMKLRKKAVEFEEKGTSS